MGILALLEGEEGTEVGLEVGSLLDDGQELGIDLSLESLALSRNLLLGLRLLTGELGLGSLLLLEELIASLLADLDTRDIDLGAGGNDVSLVDTLKRDTVDLVGAGDEEQAGGELLKEDNALATETAGEEDQDGTGSDGLTDLGGLADLAGLEGALGLLEDVGTGSLGNSRTLGRHL